MATTENEIIVRNGTAQRDSVSVLAAKTLKGGTLCYTDAATGFGTDITNAGANAFKGLVLSELDNSAGASGDVTGDVFGAGEFQMEGTGFTQADESKDAYGSDNFTVTATSAGNSVIGKFTQFISTTKMMVRIAAQA